LVAAHNEWRPNTTANRVLPFDADRRKASHDVWTTDGLMFLRLSGDDIIPAAALLSLTLGGGHGARVA
jgi:hypothetical protein